MQSYAIAGLYWVSGIVTTEKRFVSVVEQSVCAAVWWQGDLRREGPRLHDPFIQQFIPDPHLFDARFLALVEVEAQHISRRQTKVIEVA